MAASETGAEDGLLGPDEGPSSKSHSPEGSSPDSTPSPSRQQPDFSWGPGGRSTHGDYSPLPEGSGDSPRSHPEGAPELPAKRAEHVVGAGQWRTLVSWKRLSGLLALILVIVCGLWFYNLLSDAGGSGEPREPCPEVWMYYDKHCYYYAENETDWKSAKKSCEANLASLVTFRDRLEMDFILKRAGKRSYWVGLRKREKGLEWITGDLLDHKHFQTQGHEECGFIWSKNGLVISLSTCSLPRSSICKREPYS